MSRLDPLDWQRGLLALSIMLYHLTAWKFYQPDSSDILGRLGIYGVSMFFVLSGLSMALVYNSYICNARTSLIFFIRRLFRIWPLLWLAIAAATFFRILHNQEVSWIKIILNITTVFGFISPGAYINTGAWSIGNEMVYYAITPLLILIFNKKKLYGNIILTISLLVGITFAFGVLSSQDTLANQWNNYLNPFNNLFFYCTGIAIYYNLQKSFFTIKVIAIVFSISSAIFLYYPATGDQINIVTGANRVVFSIASIGMVVVFYKTRAFLPKILSVPLTQLGVVTYGVYLLHPVVFQLIDNVFKLLGIVGDPFLTIALTILLTVLGSFLSFKLLESPLIAKGKLATQRLEKAENSTLVAELPIFIPPKH